MSQPHIHPFYRIWFTTVDPIVLFFTVLACVLSPTTILESVVPASIAPFDPVSHGGLLHQSAALYGFMGVMFGVLLRASDDRKVWRIVQAATLGVDVSLLVTLWNLLRVQGRLDVGDWFAGDWFNLGFTVWVALIRVAFLAEVGGGKAEAKKIKK